MISLQINKRDPWQFTYEDYTGRDIAYRSQVQVETDYGMRYVGHVMTNMRYWGTISIDEIEIY